MSCRAALTDRRSRGAASVEYALLVVGIAAVVVLSAANMRATLVGSIQGFMDQLSAATSASGSGGPGGGGPGGGGPGGTGPTVRPTGRPTVRPTGRPTGRPTRRPTVTPTPTVSPTATPTLPGSGTATP